VTGTATRGAVVIEYHAAHAMHLPQLHSNLKTGDVRIAANHHFLRRAGRVRRRRIEGGDLLDPHLILCAVLRAFCWRNGDQRVESGLYVFDCELAILVGGHLQPSPGNFHESAHGLTLDIHHPPAQRRVPGHRRPSE
jgi:hypothetical protein